MAYNLIWCWEIFLSSHATRKECALLPVLNSITPWQFLARRVENSVDDESRCGNLIVVSLHRRFMCSQILIENFAERIRKLIKLLCYRFPHHLLKIELAVTMRLKNIGHDASIEMNKLLTNLINQLQALICHMLVSSLNSKWAKLLPPSHWNVAKHTRSTKWNSDYSNCCQTVTKFSIADEFTRKSASFSSGPTPKSMNFIHKTFFHSVSRVIGNARHVRRATSFCSFNFFSSIRRYVINRCRSRSNSTDEMLQLSRHLHQMFSKFKRRKFFLQSSWIDELHELTFDSRTIMEKKNRRSVLRGLGEVDGHSSRDQLYEAE